MANITLTKSTECASQNHLIVAVTGDITFTWHTNLDDISESITDDEKIAFLKVLVRIAKIGRTRAQIRTALTNGYTITI